MLFEDININFYNHLRTWIYGQGYSDNYFGSIIKVIKQVYREARDVDHLHNLNGTAHKNFITVAKDSDPIFLSVDELMKLYQLKMRSTQRVAGAMRRKSGQAAHGHM